MVIKPADAASCRACDSGGRVRLPALALIAMLAGCAMAEPPKMEIVHADKPVPVYVHCQIPPLINPELPIAELNPASTDAETIGAYAASIMILKGEVLDRGELLEGCK